MINIKELLIERQVNQSERLGCLMAILSKEDSHKIIRFGKRLIKEEDLYHKINESGKDEYGREMEGHITIRYGFTKDLNELDIRQLLKGHKQFMIEIYGLNKFENPEFKVSMLKVNSNELNLLNEISGIYPNKSDFPEYRPHITLGYVKPTVNPPIKEKLNIQMLIKEIYYSPISGGKSYFELEK